ncbi:MAG: hypothetical protein KKA22_08975, partial [Gammaproteobacteria bacterium]|nr:hypothetical protein [Gammaproteobacteria bacterium]MBU1408262.1 hypothetical protein [Gammaproteobacteria bacterium]
MAASFDTLRFHLGRLGWAGVAGAVLIVGSMAYDAGVVRPREAALEDQLNRNAQARRTAEALRAQAASQADAGVAARPP